MQERSKGFLFKIAKPAGVKMRIGTPRFLIPKCPCAPCSRVLPLRPGEQERATVLVRQRSEVCATQEDDSSPRPLPRKWASSR